MSAVKDYKTEKRRIIMLGLEVKDYVIGGIAVAGAGMGVANTVMNITTKKKIKKINESLNNLEAHSNNIAAKLAAVEEKLAAKDNKPEQNPTELKVDNFIEQVSEQVSDACEEMQSIKEEISSTLKENSDTVKDLNNLIDMTKKTTSELEKLINDNRVIMKTGDIYDERVKKLDMLLQKLADDFEVDTELRNAVFYIRSTVNDIVKDVKNINSFIDKDIITDKETTIGDDIDNLIEEADKSLSKRKKSTVKI